MSTPAPETQPTREDPQNAVRTALADLLIHLDPGSAGKIAVTLIRLAAAMVAIGQANEAGGPRGAASELLLLLAEGPPQLPAEPGLQAAA